MEGTREYVLESFVNSCVDGQFFWDKLNNTKHTLVFNATASRGAPQTFVPSQKLNIFRRNFNIFGINAENDEEKNRGEIFAGFAMDK